MVVRTAPRDLTCMLVTSLAGVSYCDVLTKCGCLVTLGILICFGRSVQYRPAWTPTCKESAALDAVSRAPSGAPMIKSLHHTTG